MALVVILPSSNLSQCGSYNFLKTKDHCGVFDHVYNCAREKLQCPVDRMFQICRSLHASSILKRMGFTATS